MTSFLNNNAVNIRQSSPANCDYIVFAKHRLYLITIAAIFVSYKYKFLDEYPTIFTAFLLKNIM